MRTTVSANECLIGSQFAPRLIELIDNAEKTIDVVMFEWRWYESDPSNPMQLVNNAFVRASRRGVAIRCITSNAGIVEILRGLKWKAKKLNRRGLLHSKLIILDNEVVVVGSHNLTGSAMQSNVESSMVVPCTKSSHEFRNFFERLWLS